MFAPSFAAPEVVTKNVLDRGLEGMTQSDFPLPLPYFYSLDSKHLTNTHTHTQSDETLGDSVRALPVRTQTCKRS